jgi:hypothetical protein
MSFAFIKYDKNHAGWENHKMYSQIVTSSYSGSKIY